MLARDIDNDRLPKMYRVGVSLLSRTDEHCVLEVRAFQVVFEAPTQQDVQGFDTWGSMRKGHTRSVSACGTLSSLSISSVVQIDGP